MIEDRAMDDRTDEDLIDEHRVVITAFVELSPYQVFREGSLEQIIIKVGRDRLILLSGELIHRGYAWRRRGDTPGHTLANYRWVRDGRPSD